MKIQHANSFFAQISQLFLVRRVETMSFDRTLLLELIVRKWIKRQSFLSLPFPVVEQILPKRVRDFFQK